MLGFNYFGGEIGIRTPGTSRFNSFQDCRNRPLCQLSGAKVVKLRVLTRGLGTLGKDFFQIHFSFQASSMPIPLKMKGLYFSMRTVRVPLCLASLK